jgi:hypothetical protein
VAEGISRNILVGYEQRRKQMVSSKQTDGRIVIRRVRPTDSQSVVEIYVSATRAVFVDGVSHIFYNLSSLPVAAAVSAACLMWNWWKLHVALYVVYLTLPYIIAYVAVLVFFQTGYGNVCG